MKRHTISILVKDSYGALARIVELFSSRGYNLESICSGESEEIGAQRLTLVCTADDKAIQHIIKLLEQIVLVYSVTDLTIKDSISHELILMKVMITPETRHEILQLIQSNEGKLIEINHQSISFHAIGSATKLNGLVEVFRQYKIIEIARTGEAAIHR